MKSIETNYRRQMLTLAESIYLFLRTVDKTFIPSLRDVCMRQLEEDLWTDLTERQEHVLDFVESRIVAGLPPTRQEIGQHFGIYPNAADGLLKALERKGRIVLVPNISRGIKLVTP